MVKKNGKLEHSGQDMIDILGQRAKILKVINYPNLRWVEKSSSYRIVIGTSRKTKIQNQATERFNV